MREMFLVQANITHVMLNNLKTTWNQWFPGKNNIGQNYIKEN